MRNANLRAPLPAHFEKGVGGLNIRNITRRAKYIIMECSGGLALVIHLGMSGSVTVHEHKPAHYKKHDHVILSLSDGSQLVYHDPRRFGLMLLLPLSKLPQHSLFAHLGPEPLSETWTPENLYDALQTRTAAIKTAIMDQELVVGVGNIYASEALFRSGIHPNRKANSLTRKETTRLHSAIRNVLEAAIASGGSTLRDYVRSSGESGYFQHHFSVYDKEGLACEACGSLIEVIRLAGRSSFYCPSCQK